MDAVKALELKQKTNQFEERIAIAKELGLENQVSLLKRAMKIFDIEQKNTYPEVTIKDAREAMCPKTTTEFKAKRINRWKFWDKDWAECEVILQQQGIFTNSDVVCEKIVDHNHVDQKAIVREHMSGKDIGYGENITLLPMAALLRMKEAKDKNIFHSFEVWRPESESEQEARLLDPWLVGVIGQRYFKLCDWR